MGKSGLHTDVDVSVGSVQKKEKSSKKRKSTDITDTSSTSTKTKSKSKDKASKKRKVAAEALDSTSEVDQIKGDDKEDEPTNVDSANANVQNVAEDVDAQPSKKRKLSIEEIEVDITAPEPPSKKALRALKKGKPLPPSKSGAEPTAEAGEKKAEVEKRSEHGIWIGNLPFHVSKDDLRKFFVEYSDIMEDAITRVHMPSPDDKKSANQVQEQKVGRKVHNKGFAYVDFKSAKDVTEAIELSEQLLGGRRVLIKDSKSFEGRPQKTKEEIRPDGKPPNKRVFLGNLRFDVTEESIKEHFEKCGPVESVKVATFEDSGKCKGYAWVVFEELEAAGHAVRGYVMKEEEDSAAESGSESESDEEGHKSKPKKKLRKWWVNKIMGRPLRVEYAEDAQIRYKKRYGKGGSKKDGAGEANGDDASAKVHSSEKAPKVPVKYDLPYGGAHLTGGIVEATGKKITF